MCLKAFKHICCRSSYDSFRECLEYAGLPIFKHFSPRIFVCFAQILFSSKNLCFATRKRYFRYDSERFSIENYQATGVFGNPLR